MCVCVCAFVNHCTIQIRLDEYQWMKKKYLFRKKMQKCIHFDHMHSSSHYSSTVQPSNRLGRTESMSSILVMADHSQNKRSDDSSFPNLIIQTRQFYIDQMIVQRYQKKITSVNVINSDLMANRFSIRIFESSINRFRKKCLRISIVAAWSRYVWKKISIDWLIAQLIKESSRACDKDGVGTVGEHEKGTKEKRRKEEKKRRKKRWRRWQCDDVYSE